MENLSDEAQRRRAIAWAIALTANTPLAPQAYERELLERFARGELTIDQVLLALDTQVQHVLYRSRAVQPFSLTQLAELLEESRAYNEAHDITGLLCYCEGHFVQLLEGPPAEVQRLYANIRRDPRHQQVLTLHDAAGSLLRRLAHGLCRSRARRIFLAAHPPQSPPAPLGAASATHLRPALTHPAGSFQQDGLT